MSKADRSEVFRELYVQYHYLKTDKKIFEKIILLTNGAVKLRTLQTYKTEWQKKGLQKELNEARKKRIAQGKMGSDDEPDEIKITVPNGKIRTVKPDELVITSIKTDISGLKPVDIVKRICTEYTRADSTLENLLFEYGTPLHEFDKIIQSEPDLTLLWEQSKKIQARNIAMYVMDNAKMWLKKTSGGTAEITESITYEMVPISDPNDPTKIIYVDIPISKTIRKTVKPPTGKMLETLMSAMKDAQMMDATKFEEFVQLAEGYNIDQVDEEIRMYEELKQKRLNERTESNDLRNRAEDQHPEAN